MKYKLLMELFIFSAIESKFKAKSTEKNEIKENYEEERNFLKILINKQKILKELCKNLDNSYFYNEDYKQIFSILKENMETEINFSLLIEKIKEERIKDLLSCLIVEKFNHKNMEILEVEMQIKNLQEELTKLNKLFLQEKNPNLLLEKIALIGKIDNLRKKIGEKLWKKQ